jgi:hypothetical protein
MPKRLDASRSEERSLRGFIDGILVARDFIELQGWICRADNASAEPPLTFAVNGRSFSGFGLSERHDLAEANIADGMAAVDLVLLVKNFPIGAECAIEVTDATGAVCTLTCAPDRLTPFWARGAFDSGDGWHIGGWLFDPGATPAKPPQILMDDEFLAVPVLTIDRADLPFDLGDGRRLYGFQVPMEVARREFRRRNGAAASGTATLTLASGGCVLATAQVILGDQPAALVGTTVVIPPRRLHASDMLDRLLAST